MSLPPLRKQMSLIPLWKHQERELSNHYDDPARGLLWSMRSGKTRVIIETASRLYKEGRITGLLVTAPNGVHAQWANRQLPEWATCDVGPVLAWRSKDTKPKHVEGFLLGNGGLSVLTLNVEALQLKRVQDMVRAFLKAHGGGSKLMVVFDESHDFRRPGARRTRLARGLAKRCAFRRILTGTAALNSPLHLFSQFELLEPCALGHRTFTSFKAHHADYAQQTLANGRTFPKLTGYRNLEELRNWVGLWASVVPRSQADVPDVLKTERLVMLSQPQKRAYEDLKKDMLSVIDEGGTTLHDIQPHIMKGQQIFGGFIHASDGTIHSIDDNPPRLTALVEEVQGSEGKVIVWCRFTEDIRRCVAALTGAGVRVVEYHGGVNDRGREATLDTFQNSDDPVCLVGQPQSAGSGLDLSAGSTIIWYSHVHDAIVREQATARASVKGGEAVVLVDLIAEGTFDDRKMLNALTAKADLNDELAGEGLAALLSME